MHVSTHAHTLLHQLRRAGLLAALTCAGIAPHALGAQTAHTGTAAAATAHGAGKKTGSVASRPQRQDTSATVALARMMLDSRETLESLCMRQIASRAALGLVPDLGGSDSQDDTAKLTAVCVQGNLFVLTQHLHARFRREDPESFEVFESLYQVTRRMNLILVSAR